MKNTCLLIVIIVFLQCITTASSFQSKEKEILDSIIGPGKYDRRIRPVGANETGPVISYVDLNIRNIESISAEKMEYTVQLTLRERWNDDRLSFASSEDIHYLTLPETGSLWMPDLFFQNEKQGNFHNVLAPNLYIKIFPNGDVLYSTRVTLTLFCPMNLAYFPHDRQECQLKIASYSWTTEGLVFLWQNADPVQISNNLHLPRFRLEEYSSGYCNSKSKSGEYSCLLMSLTFKREFQYYLVQYYMPSCLIVIVSWISFWLDTNAATARIALGITTLLIMSLQISSINQLIPPVSYLKAIDWWSLTCLTLVFGALLEFATVNYFSTLEERIKKENSKKNKNQNEMEQQPEQAEEGASAVEMKPLEYGDSVVNGETGKGEPGDSQKDLLASLVAKYPCISMKIDKISRIVFPLVFTIFNLAYWCTYAH